MSHENFGSYFCYNLPNNSIYRVWFFYFKSVLNLVECLKEIANGEYGITASFIGSIFTVSSYRISNNKPICTAISQVILFPCSASKGLKNEKCLLTPLQPNIRLRVQPNIRPAEDSAKYSADMQISLSVGYSRLLHITYPISVGTPAHRKQITAAHG